MPFLRQTGWSLHGNTWANADTQCRLCLDEQSRKMQAAPKAREELPNCYGKGETKAILCLDKPLGFSASTL
jgi:hypothetical protein